MKWPTHAVITLASITLGATPADASPTDLMGRTPSPTEIPGPGAVEHLPQRFPAVTSVPHKPDGDSHQIRPPIVAVPATGKIPKHM